MGLFSALGSLLGGGSAKKASRKAEAAQLAAIQQAIGEQRRQFDLTRSDYEPWRDAGADALGGLRALVGLDGADASGAAISALRDSPLFQTLYDQGEEAVLQNAAATGGIRGGNTQRGLADFGADTLTQVIENQLSRLGGISGLGLNATSGTAQSGDNITQAISQLLGQQGQVRAGGILTRGGINSQMWNNAGSFLDQLNPMKLIPGIGGLF